MTNYNIMNKEEKRKAIKHKLEFETKNDIYGYWSHRDITGNEKAIKRMKDGLERLKRYNSNSEYIERITQFIKKCEKEVI